MGSSVNHFDVVIVGGGPAGFGAAVGAARNGASVALLERHPILGGMGTAALVNNFCPAHLDGSRLIIGGAFGEIRDRLIEEKSIFSAPDNASYMMEAFNPEAYADLMVKICEEAGVQLFTGTSIESIEQLDGSILFKTTSGEIFADYLVDATGDGFAAAALGLQFTFGRASDNAVMPLTYCFEIGPIDYEKAGEAFDYDIPTHPVTGEKYYNFCCQGDIQARIEEAKAKGDLTIPRSGIACCMNYPGKVDHATVNFTRVMIKDPTDPVELAAAQEEGAQQVDEAVAFFQKYFPGFEGIELKRKALQIGVRESRQIKGLHTLTGTEARDCTQFEDVIAQCCYAIDIHEHGKETSTLIEFERGTHFDIPWRSLIPTTGPGNITIAGRCISADTEAMSAFRVAPSAMAIGEAAGTTAALASKKKIPVAELGHEPVQEALLANGAILS